MQISLILLILALSGAGATYYFSGLYQNLAFLVWFPLLLTIIYWIVGLALWLLYLIVLSLFYKKDAPQKKIRWWVLWPMIQVCWIIQLFFFIRIKVSNKEAMKGLRGKNFFLVCNHTSNLDQIMVWAKFRRYTMITLGKPELEALPIIGKHMRRAGIVCIDRSSPMKAIRGISTSISLLKKCKYASMAVYPEGTRHKDGEMQEFHSTPFLIPEKLKCPLVVISLQNTNKLKERKYKKITNVYLDVIKVFSADEVSKMSAQEMADISHKLIKDNLEKHKDRLY